MRITDIRYLYTITPKGASGTGYSEPDKFEITFDNGYKRQCVIDCWYRSNDKQVFEEEMYNLLQEDYNIDSISNLYDAYKMYKEEKVLNNIF